MIMKNTRLKPISVPSVNELTLFSSKVTKLALVRIAVSAPTLEALAHLIKESRSQGRKIKVCNKCFNHCVLRTFRDKLVHSRFDRFSSTCHISTMTMITCVSLRFALIVYPRARKRARNSHHVPKKV